MATSCRLESTDERHGASLETQPGDAASVAFSCRSSSFDLRLQPEPYLMEIAVTSLK